MEPLPQAWGSPTSRTCWFRDPGVLGCWSRTLHWGLLPAPKARLLGGLWLQSGLWLARAPPGCAPPGGAGGAGRGGVPPIGLGSLSPSSETRRAGGRCSFLLACYSRFHPLPFMSPTTHSYRSHSFKISASGHSAFEAHLLCASGPWAASESHSAEGISAPLLAASPRCSG